MQDQIQKRLEVLQREYTQAQQARSEKSNEVNQLVLYENQLLGRISELRQLLEQLTNDNPV